MIAVAPSAIAPISAARWEIDLSGGGRSSPRSGPEGSKPRHRRDRTTPWPSSRTISAARSASSSPATHSETAPVRMSAAGYSAMSSMLTPGAARARARSRRRCPGGSRRRAAARSSCPPTSSASSRRRRSSRAARATPRPRSASPERISSAASRSRSDDGVDLARDRLAVGGEDVAPDRRVRAGDPGRVAEARPHLGQALGLLDRRRRGLLDEHVREHVRQVADRRHQPVVRLGVDRLRAGADVGDRALQPVVVHAARSARSASGTSGRPRTGRRARCRRRRSRRPRADGRR